MRRAITLLLHQPAVAQEVTVPEGLSALSYPGLRLLGDMLSAAYDEPDMKPARLADNFSDHADGGGALARLLTENMPADEHFAWGEELQDALNAILRDSLEHRYDELVGRAATPEGLNEAEIEEFRELPARISSLRPGSY